MMGVRSAVLEVEAQQAKAAESEPRAVTNLEAEPEQWVKLDYFEPEYWE
jgi:hypothetical protein